MWFVPLLAVDQFHYDYEREHAHAGEKRRTALAREARPPKSEWRRARPGLALSSGLLRCAGLGLQRVLGFLDQAVECHLVVNGEVAEHLAVEPDIGGMQPFDEAAVAHTGVAAGGV